MLRLNWDDVQRLASFTASRIFSSEAHRMGSCIKLYGIPYGGFPAVLAVQNELASKGIASRIVDAPGDAEVFVDDIVQSGKTRQSWRTSYPETPFFALVNRLERTEQGPLPYTSEVDRPNQWVSFPWERSGGGLDAGPDANVLRLLQYIGEDPTREGLLGTPGRVVRSYAELFAGYKQDPKEIMTVFEEPCDELVLLKDVEFSSTCEHHMLPFVGKAHVAYIPSGKVIGISKLARLLNIYAKRLQIQERIGQQVTTALNQHLAPLGAACILEAQHHCMICRGVLKQNSVMVTSSLTGVFRSDTSQSRAELFQLIRG